MTEQVLTHEYTEPETIVVPKRYRVGVWNIALGVFVGMWMFALSAGLVVLILQATGDLPR